MPKGTKPMRTGNTLFLKEYSKIPRRKRAVEGPRTERISQQMVKGNTEYRDGTEACRDQIGIKSAPIFLHLFSLWLIL
jgi:hypothetical protein